jgi:hypothetical protein
MFRYYSPHNTSCRVTVVGEHNDGVLNIAVARCSKKDNFNKKIGRNIAEGRLAKKQIYFKTSIQYCTTSDFLKHAKSIAEEVCSTKITKIKK